jgi:Leucine-rich repeat (LRR) protein
MPIIVINLIKETTLFCAIVLSFIFIGFLSNGASAQTPFDCSTATEIPQAECEALVALYNSTDGPNWINNFGWLVTNTPCTTPWSGVVCTSGRVRLLDLSQNQLSGGIPTELVNLSDLHYFYLASNQLSGDIPPVLGQMSSLRAISLSNNQLTGSIPPELSDLSNLESLSLSGNQLSGDIPPELGRLPNLWRLHLADNLLSGHIPPELGDLSGLGHLFLNGNPALSGPLPSTLTNLLSLGLFYFNDTALCEPEDTVFQNWLSGINNLERTGVICTQADFICANVTEIPQTECEALVALYNSTDGPNWTDNAGWLLTDTPCTTPWYGVNCDSGHVDIINLAGNQLTGHVPPQLGNLANLERLFLWANPELSGPLPSTLTDLTLTHFFFSNTALCEPEVVEIQTWLFVIPNLERTGVTCTPADFICGIVNEVPQAECQALVSLYNSTAGANWTDNSGWLLTDTPCSTPWHGVNCHQEHVSSLSLYNNQLSGDIPPELGDLSGLVFLYLEYNQLTGEIPPALGDLSSLLGLRLEHNQLTGEIPPELGDLSSLTVLMLSHNQLISNIPSALTTTS